MELSQQREVSSVLRPLSVGELLDRAINLFRDQFLLFFVIGLLPRTVAFAQVLLPVAVVYFFRESVVASPWSVFGPTFAVWIVSLPIEMMALAVSHAITMQVI